MARNVFAEEKQSELAHQETKTGIAVRNGFSSLSSRPMPKVFLFILAGLLVCLPGSSIASSDGVDTPLDEKGRCNVTIRGNHGGATDEITFDAGESQVRTRVGWWASLAQGGDVALHELSPGQSFEEEYNLRLGCNAHRRYRFVFRAGGETHTYVFPSEDGFTQELNIDLGDVSRFFDWIEPGAPPTSEQPGTVEPSALAGEWVRRESNNDPNDGMRISVTGDRAELTFVPETASSAHWDEGEVLWRNVSADGTLEVLGSDDNYYDAEILMEGVDRLHIDIAHNGAGNDQTWERESGCWTDEYMATVSDTAPDMWVRFSTALPMRFQDALRAARDAHAPIQTAALTPDNEWVVVAANKPCYSTGFPPSVREWIDDYIDSGREIDVVAFGPGGRWIVVAEDLLRRTNNVSDDIMEDIRHAQSLDRRITSISFSANPDNGYVITAGKGGYWGDGTDPNVRAAIASASRGQRPVHEAAVALSGAWVVVAEDWFATRNAPTSLREQLESYRTDNLRRIDHVILHEMDGAMRWTIISNSPEPTPDASDLVNVFEQQLTGDSTVFQRMKTHNITGLSIALVRNNQVEWTRGYGLREVDVPESYVHANTIFDAASISKPVSYAAALQLVDEGEFGLTETGVLMDLANNLLPPSDTLLDRRADEISLAHLLSHCAGIDNQKGTSGAQGIELGNALPSIRQVFLGQPPASSGNRIVRIDTVEVGEMTDYSGANSIMIQALMERYADGGYDGQMERLLDNLDMNLSTVETDFWETMRRERFAFGHDSTATGTEKRDVRVYPNQAAAGLRTTAGDLANFVIMLNQGGLFEGNRLLDSTTVDQFIGRDGAGMAVGVAESVCASLGTMRLGMRAQNLGTMNELYTHGGLHNGYRTYLSGIPRQQAGVVIMITGALNDADPLRDEIRAALRAAYGWGAL